MELSLIIPVYNVEKYVGDCLKSIINQNINTSRYEIIIINDGTLDASMDKVRDVVNGCSNVIIHNQENKGLSVARNEGLRIAHGDYVWFIDSDDWLKDYSLSVVLKKIEQNPDVDVFVSALTYCYDGNMRLESCSWIVDSVITGKEYIKCGYRLGATPRFIMSRRLLLEKKISFYPNLLHEDGLFGHIMMYYAEKVWCLRESLYIYRQSRNGSIMNSLTIKNSQACLFIHKKLIEFMNSDVADDDKCWYRKSIFICIISSLCFLKELSHDKIELFIRENRNYIKSECDACFEQKAIKWNLKLLIIKYFPFVYIHFFIK